MDSFVNITGNLAAAPKDGSTWLIANGKTKYKCIWEGRTSLIGYDTLGISAGFRSWLNNYNDLNSGAYGIQIDIMSQKATSQTEGSPLYYTFYFSSKEMLGDPYNYDTFYLQEKTFDISGIKQIDAIRIGFFQDADFKSNSSGYLIAQEEDILNANLFINDPVVAIGYNANKFSEDTVILTTKDSEMYLTEPTELVKINYPNIDYENETAVQELINTLNTKNINLRWVHLLTEEEQTGIYNVSSSGISATRVLTIADFADFDQPFNISWYRYIYDENIDYSGVIWDANAGEYWIEIERGYNHFDLQINPDIKKPEEQYKAIIEYPSKQSVLDSIESYLSQKNGLYDLESSLLNTKVEIDNVNYLETILLNSDTQDALSKFKTDIYQPTLTNLDALEYKDANKVQELQELIQTYNDLNTWTNKIHQIIYNMILDLYNINISEFLLQLSIEIEELKKNNIEDNDQLETLAQSIILSSSVFNNIRVLKLFFPQLMNNFQYLLMNSGYNNYSANIYDYLNNFKSIILKDVDENASITNIQEKQALKIIQSVISKAINIENQIRNYRNTEIGSIKYYSSSPIIFKNTDPTASFNVLKDALSNLEIVVDENGYQGTYNLYEEDGHIQNDNDANEIRTLEAKYEKYSSDSNPVENNEIITWRIPIFNTMIQYPEEGVEYSEYDECTKAVYNAAGTEIITEGEVTKENYKSSKYFYYDEEDNQYIQITPLSTLGVNENPITDFYDSIGQFYVRNNTKVSEENGYMIISRPGDPIQNFRIKPFCEASFTNNEIFCTVEKDLINLEASASLSFSPVGNSGTNYTFYLEFYDNQNQFALQALGFSQDEVEKKKHELKVRARLFDEVHNEITHNQGMQFKWTLLGGPGAEINNNVTTAENVIRSKTPQANTWVPNNFNNLIIKCQCAADIALGNDGENNNLVEIDEAGNIIASPQYISGDNGRSKTNINLTAYLSVPVIKNKEKVGGYVGSGLISYDNAGTNPFYYNGNFKIYDTNLQELKYIPQISSGGNITQQRNNYWMNYGAAVGEEKYFPQITYSGSLTVPSLYLQENKQTSIHFVVNNIIEFILPLRIYKRVYASKVINAWDGSLTLNENDGIILSTMMGAGKKDNQNRFNGVLMGDIALAAGESESDSLYYSGTGLYGYNEGQKSFGFNINGYGFLGRSGAGQILFDGNSGKIESANYVAGSDGTLLDLSNGFFETAEAVLREGCWIGGYNSSEAWSITGHTILNQYKQDVDGVEVDRYMGIGTLGHSYAFFAGAASINGSDGIFRVGHDGALTATNVNLQGKITASKKQDPWRVEFYKETIGEIKTTAPDEFKKNSEAQAFSNNLVAAERWSVSYPQNSQQLYRDDNGTHTGTIVLDEDTITIKSNYTSTNSNIGNPEYTFTIAPTSISYVTYSGWTKLYNYIYGRIKTTRNTEGLSFSCSAAGGQFIFRNKVNINGGIDVFGSAYLSGNISILGGAEIGGSVELNSNLSVWGYTYFEDNVYFEYTPVCRWSRLCYDLNFMDYDGVVKSGGTGASWESTGSNVTVEHNNGSTSSVKRYRRLCVGAASSKKYKTDIEILNNDFILELYDAINVYNFKYKNNYLSNKDERYNKKVPGFIAEEWDSILPIAVNHVDNQAEMWNSQIVVPLMFQMIKNNHEEIQQLQEEIKKLKEKIYENK